jgi:hypothetical protein
MHILLETLRSDASASPLASLLGKCMLTYIYLRGCVHRRISNTAVLRCSIFNQTALFWKSPRSFSC